jgi:hypothetical protein
MLIENDMFKRRNNVLPTISTCMMHALVGGAAVALRGWFVISWLLVGGCVCGRENV